jgi:ABC-2 type transport system ATP-binding protein
MIKIEGLTKVFSSKTGPAIDSVSFTVDNGEVVGFVGLNGAGKTTTIRIASGVSLPTSGRVGVDGYDVVAQKVEASKRIGWVPELPIFEPNAKAISLMEYFAGFYGISPSDSASRSAALLKSVGLEGSETKKIRAYSQGMKKRFSLAASMLGDPQNYLFDEVLNGLDPEGIRYFRELMQELKKQNKAILLSSHILVEVESIADRVIFIHKGKVIKTIDRNDIANFSGSSIKIVIANLDDRALVYLRGLGEVRTDGNTVFVTSKTADGSRINSDLLKMGYQVEELTRQNEGLEKYFLDLIGEAK